MRDSIENINNIQKKYIKITTTYSIDKNIMEFLCLADCDYETEYAWYLLKCGEDESYEKIIVVPYLDDNSFSFDISTIENGEYVVQAFAQTKENNDIHAYKDVIRFTWDRDTEQIDVVQ